MTSSKPWPLERVQIVDALGKSCLSKPSAPIRQQHVGSELKRNWNLSASLVVEPWLVGRESDLGRDGSSEIASSMMENVSSGMKKSAAPLEYSKSLVIPLESTWLLEPTWD